MIFQLPFIAAKRYLKELKRICTNYIYISLISKEQQSSGNDEIVVKTDHEKGTIQSYYDVKKIEDLLEIKIQSLEYFRLNKIIDPITQSIFSARYFLVINMNVA